MKVKHARSNPAGKGLKMVGFRANSLCSPVAKLPGISHLEPSSDRLLPSLTARLERILVAVDFSEVSNKALKYAISFARQSGAAITLLHVAEPIACHADYGYGAITRQVPNARLLGTARRKLGTLGKRVAGCGFKVATVVRSGVPHQEITQAARDLDTDLIVIGIRGEDASNRRPISPTTDRVVWHAPCPVLVVRKKEHEFVWHRKSRQ
jgi:universal stress protein A